MTTEPQAQTSERERLIVQLEEADVIPRALGLAPTLRSKALDMLRADAEKIRALEADAARYQAIRDQINGVGGWALSIFAENCEGYGEILTGSKADEAIDAAIKRIGK